MTAEAEAYSAEVEVSGATWRFVVYAGGTYTLVDPDGRPVPPMGLVPPAEIERHREAARHAGYTSRAYVDGGHG